MEKKYPSTRFVLLQNTESYKNNGNKKIIWITLLLGILLLTFPSILIYYKQFLSSGEQDRFSSIIVSTEVSPKTFSISKIWLEKTKQRNNQYLSDLICGDHQPLIIVQSNMNYVRLEVEDFMIQDLVIYYQQIINDYDPYTLKSVFNNLQKKLILAKHPEDFRTFLGSLNSNRINFYLSENHVFNMYRFKYFFDLTEELSEWYDYLYSLREYLSSYEQQRNRQIVKVIEYNFESFVNKTQGKFRHTYYKFSISEKKLLEINQVLFEWMAPMKVSVNNSSVILYNRAILLSKVKEAINLSFDNIYVFASHAIYIDEDLTLPGINVAIVAPKWVHLKKVTINLNGRPGKIYEDATDGQHGKPGRPGENSGDFLGVGDLNEKLLVVLVNGGRGGRGQNGARGQDGVNNSLPLPPRNKPNCVLKLNNFTNQLGELITRYKVFNPAGCGKPGTDGGAGGIGGKAGKVILLNRKIEMGLNGVQGAPGKGGIGGRGGIGCFYEIFDVDDEVLHLITGIKCHNDTLPSGNAGADNYNTKGQMLPLQKANFSISDVLLNFIHFSGKDFVDFNNSIITLFSKQLSSFYINYFIAKQFQVFKTLDKDEFYKILENSIDQTSDDDQIQKALILGKRLILRKTNFLFIDFESYIEALRTNIKSLQNSSIYPESPLNVKFAKKLIKIKNNLNTIKTRFYKVDFENNTLVMKGLEVENNNKILEIASVLHKRRVLYFILAFIESISCFVAQIIEENSCLSYLKSLKAVQLKKEEFFKKSQNVTTQQKQILSQVLSISEFKAHSSIYLKAVKLMPNFILKEQIYYEKLNRNQLEGIKSVLESCVNVLSIDERILLEGFVSEVDNFIGLYPIVEWHELEKKFRKSLTNLKFHGTQSRVLQKELRDIMITLQYVSVVDAAQLKLHPLKKLQRHLRGTNDIAEEAIAQINNLSKPQILICQNLHETIFDKNTSVGEFFFWSNFKIKKDLLNLFSGKQIKLKADLNNHHVLDKNFIKFKTLKFEFGCEEYKNLNWISILNDFRIEITHSGYSYYNWKGQTVVVVSEEITFDYGLKDSEDGKPEVYNILLEKLQNGDIMLSPYTTWTIRLIPSKNGYHTNLLKLINCDLRLTGKGTFVS